MSGAILVVDDMPYIREPIAASLCHAGYQARCAATGAEALSIILNDPPALVLLDLEMPGMNGLDLIKALRELKTYRTIPILILARDASDENIKKAEALGASGFIEKPFTPERLLSVVNQVLVDTYVN